MNSLNRSLGLVSLVFYGVGVIVGAGVYSVIGAAAGEAGYSLWASFVFAGIAAGLTAMSYAELISALPKAGAEYIYVKRAFPKQEWLATVVGIIVIFSGAATAATVTYAFAGYLNALIPISYVLVAYCLAFLGTVINIFGIKESSWVNIVFTLIEIAGLVLIIWAGTQSSSFAENVLQFEAFGLLKGAALIFFVYTGFEGLANLAEETKSPERTLPKALLASLFITLVLYILVALAVVALVPPQELSKSSSPLADAISRYSPSLTLALVWVALFSTANTGLINLVVSSRVLYGMAKHGNLPKFFARTLPKRKTPWVGALVLFGLTGLLLPFGEVKTIANISSFSALLSFTAVNASLIVLRFREPELKRAFMVPGVIGKVPILPCIAIICVLCLATQFDIRTYTVGAVMLVVAGALHVVTTKVANSPKKNSV